MELIGAYLEKTKPDSEKIMEDLVKYFEECIKQMEEQMSQRLWYPHTSLIWSPPQYTGQPPNDVQVR